MHKSIWSGQNKLVMLSILQRNSILIGTREIFPSFINIVWEERAPRVHNAMFVFVWMRRAALRYWVRGRGRLTPTYAAFESRCLPPPHLASHNATVSLEASGLFSTLQKCSATEIKVHNYFITRCPRIRKICTTFTFSKRQKFFGFSHFTIKLA